MFDKSHFNKNSDKKVYPWHERNSSNSICDTSLESFKKQKTATNISTISNGVNWGTRCILSIQSATHPFAKKILNFNIDKFFIE